MATSQPRIVPIFNSVFVLSLLYPSSSTSSWARVKKKWRQNYYVNGAFLPSEGQMTSCYGFTVVGTEKSGGKND